jgi:hypothetical protein
MSGLHPRALVAQSAQFEHRRGTTLTVLPDLGCDDLVDPELRDRQVRTSAFQFLAEQTALHGDVLLWSVLSEQFEFEDQRVPLIGPQGIFKPAVLPVMPISIATVPVTPGRDRPRPGHATTLDGAIEEASGSRRGQP